MTTRSTFSRMFNPSFNDEPTLIQRLIDIRANFKSLYNDKAQVCVRAPGQIILLGTNSDLALGCNIPRSTIAAGTKTHDDQITISFCSFPEKKVTYSLDSIATEENDLWAKAIIASIRELNKSGQNIGGANILLATDIPQLNALGWLPSLCYAATLCLNSLYEIELEPIKLSQICDLALKDLVAISSVPLAICSLAQKDFFLGLDLSSTPNKKALLPSSILGSASLVISFENSLPFTENKKETLLINDNKRVLASISALQSNSPSTIGELLTDSANEFLSGQKNKTKLSTLLERSCYIDGVLGSRQLDLNDAPVIISLVKQKNVSDFCSALAIQYKSCFNEEIFSFEIIPTQCAEVI